MTNSITNRQLFFVLYLTLMTNATVGLVKNFAATSGRSSWIPIIAVSIIAGIFVIIITKLNNMYLGKVLFDYSQEIVGKFFAYLIAIYFLLYYLMIGAYLNVTLVGLLKSNFLPETPQFATLFAGILLFGYVAYKGMTNVARMFEIIGFLFLISTVGVCLFMLREGMNFNILPFFTTTDAKEFLYTAKDLAPPFAFISVLLIIPFSPINKKAPKVAFLSLLFIGLFYVLVTESTLMVLGLNNSLAMHDAFIEAIKIVEIPVFERADLFYLTITLAALFCGSIIIYTATVEFACKIFAKVTRVAIVISVGIIFYILSLLALKINNPDDIFQSIAPFFAIITSMLIPTSLFIIAKVKKWAAGQNSG